MKNRSKTFISVVLLLSALLNLCGCGKKNKYEYTSGAYTFSAFDIPEKEGYESFLKGVMKDGENVCIPVVYVKFDESLNEAVDVRTDIYTVNVSGEIIYTLEVMGSQPPVAILNNEYAYLGYSTSENQDSGNMNSNNSERKVAVFLDKKTGDLTKVIQGDDEEFEPNYIVPISDGVVLVGETTICKYSDSGTLQSKVETGFTCFHDAPGFFEEDGHYFVIEEIDMDTIAYHEVDFEKGTCTRKCESNDIGIVLSSNVSGSYFFNPDGEYKVDLINMKSGCIANWNSIDIRPPKTTLYSPSKRYALDDNCFAISYEYYNHSRSKEVLIFHFDPSIDRTNITTIKIGGFGVFDDLMLQWVVYDFNITNKEYRVVLEDYSQRFGAAYEDAVKGKLNLMKYFNDGNSPDIFYGTEFDYEYMGRNGMVIDMSEYLKEESNSDIVLTEKAKELLFDGTGSCYQLFASYYLNGYYASQEVVEAVGDLSLYSLYTYAKENDITVSLNPAANALDEALEYSFPDLWGAYDGKKKVTREELEKMISEVVSVPISDNNLAVVDDVENGRVLVFPAICSSYYDEEDRAKSYSRNYTFIGYPSVHGAVHLAVPQCLMAISTTAKNKDKCWEVVSKLFSEDVQNQAVVSQYVPVTEKAMSILCDSILAPKESPLESWRELFGNRELGNQAILDKYLENIGTADTIAVYDWGLFSIITDEVNSFYSQNRTPAQIAETLDKRLTIYMQENY